MAVVITELFSLESDGIDHATVTSGSFTPTAGGRLFVWVAADGSSPTVEQVFTITNTGSGLTWASAGSPIAESTDVSDFRCALFEAAVDGSPSSMTVTVDPFAAAQLAWMSLVVFEITGAPAGFVQTIGVAGETEGGGASESLAVSLPGNATSGNLVVACFGAQNDASDPFTNPTGWTELTNQWANYTHCLVTSRTDFTTASVTCTDLGTTINRSGAVIFEINALTVPNAPTIDSQAGGHLRAGVQWTAGPDGGSAVTSWDIDWATAAAPTTWLGPTNTASTLPYGAVTGLTNGTAYVFRVRAVNAIGNGAWSSTSGSATPSDVRGFFLLQDGTSKFLLQDGTSKFLLQSGAAAATTAPPMRRRPAALLYR